MQLPNAAGSECVAAISVMSSSGGRVEDGVVRGRWCWCIVELKALAIRLCLLPPSRRQLQPATPLTISLTNGKPCKLATHAPLAYLLRHDLISTSQFRLAASPRRLSLSHTTACISDDNPEQTDMPKASKLGFYAVARGRVPGIYSTWYAQSHFTVTSRLTLELARDECQQQVSGFLGNKHQKFPTLEQARAYLAQQGVNVGESSTASSSTAPPPPHRSHGSKPYYKPSTTNANSQDKPRGSKWAALTTEVIADESGWDVVYSDGACKGNGKVGSVAGIGVWWGANDPRYAFFTFVPPPLNATRTRNLAERCPGGQTNNRAELIVRASAACLLFLADPS